MAIISFSFRVETSTHHTQALFQTLKTFHGRLSHIIPFCMPAQGMWTGLSRALLLTSFFCHLVKTIYIPHLHNCADSHSVCHANKGSSIAGCACVNKSVIMQTNEAIRSMKYDIASSHIHFKFRHSHRHVYLGKHISIYSRIYYFVTLLNTQGLLLNTPAVHINSYQLTGSHTYLERLNIYIQLYWINHSDSEPKSSKTGAFHFLLRSQ